MIEVLKEPGAHYIGGRLWKNAPLFLLSSSTIVVVLALGSVAATERCVAQERAYVCILVLCLVNSGKLFEWLATVSFKAKFGVQFRV